MAAGTYCKTIYASFCHKIYGLCERARWVAVCSDNTTLTARACRPWRLTSSQGVSPHDHTAPPATALQLWCRANQDIQLLPQCGVQHACLCFGWRSMAYAHGSCRILHAICGKQAHWCAMLTTCLGNHHACMPGRRHRMHHATRADVPWRAPTTVVTAEGSPLTKVHCDRGHTGCTLRQASLGC